MFVSDARLLQRVQRGNRDAFGLIVERHSSAVYAVALALVANRNDAEDIVQDTFVKAMEAIGSLRDGTSLRAWLTAIARNTARNWLRRRAIEHNAVDRLKDAFPPPSTAASDLERREFVAQHLAEIGDGHREVLLLRYYAGLSDREIAEALGITRTAVRKRLQRAREALSLEVVRGLNPAAEKAERDRMGTKVRAALGLGTLGWPDWTRTLSAQWSSVAASAAVLAAGAVVVISGAYRQEPGGASPPPAPVQTATAAPIVLAQNEPDAPVEPAQQQPTLLKIVGGLVKKEVSLSDGKAGRISGIAITDEDGEPVPGASVRLEHLDFEDYEAGPTEREEFTAVTDGAGRFSVAELPGGRYGIEIHSDGLVGAESAELQGRRMSDQVTVKMKPALPLGGTVRDEAGKAIEGAVIYIHTHESLSRGRPVVWDETTAMRQYSDTEGRFDFEGVYTGGLTLLAKAEGYAPELTDTIQAGTMDTVIVMGKGGSLSGVAQYMDGGKPVAGKTLLFRGELDRFQGSATTDGEGRFTAANLREGPYHIVLDDPELVTTPDSSAVEVIADQSKSGVVVLVRDGGHVKGRVFDTTTKQGMAGVTVNAESAGAAGLNRTTVSADDGSFEMAGLGAGDYMVSPEPPKGYRRPFGSYQRNRTTAIDLDVPYAVRDCDLEPTAEIMGRVIDEEGKPVAFARVGIAGGGGTYVGTSTESAEDGFFQFESLPRTTDLWLTARKDELTSESIELETDEQHLLNLEVVVRKGASIEGTIVDEDGTPIPNAHIYASMSGSRNGGGSADADGRGAFVLSGLAAGKYLLMAQRDDRPYTNYGVSDNRPRVEVAFGEHVKDYVLVLTDGAKIGGIVVDPDGRPVADVSIDGPNDEKSDEEGRFEVAGLYSDFGQLSFFKKGYIRQTIPRIPAGTADLTVTLVPTGTIRGRVVDATTKEPLVSVQLGTQTTDYPLYLTTNRMRFFPTVQLEDGEFEIESDLIGAGTLIVRAEGYGIVTVPIGVSSDGEVDVSEIALPPLTPLEVLVVDASGGPVAGASIYQGNVTQGNWAGEGDREGVTDSAGRLTIATYPVEGGVVCAFHQRSGVGRAVVPEQVTEPVTITLSDTAAVTGRVTLSHGSPAGSTVYAMTAGRDSVEAWQAELGTDGTYRIENAPLTAEKLTVWRRYDSDSGGSWALEVPVALVAGEENTVDFDVPLGPLTMVVRVLAFDAQATQMSCTLEQPDMAPGVKHRGFTGSGTDVEFDGIFPGPATITAEASDLSGRRVSWGPVAVTIPDAPDGPLVIGAEQP